MYVGILYIYMYTSNIQCTSSVHPTHNNNYNEVELQGNVPIQWQECLPQEYTLEANITNCYHYTRPLPHVKPPVPLRIKKNKEV